MVCLALLAFWLRSYAVGDRVMIKRRYSQKDHLETVVVSSGRGAFAVGVVAAHKGVPGVPGFTFTFAEPPAVARASRGDPGDAVWLQPSSLGRPVVSPDSWRFLGFAHWRKAYPLPAMTFTDEFWEAPYWPAAILAAILPALWAGRALRERNKRTRGFDVRPAAPA